MRVISTIFLPSISTCSISGFSRLPLHAGHGRAAMYLPSSSRTYSEVELSYRRFRFGMTPS